MTLLVCYPSKQALKTAIGRVLSYRETTRFTPEYKPNGLLTVAYRPYIWKHADGGREFFAIVTMENGLIAKVE